MKPTIWMLAFESKPLVKIGGLGEVPFNLADQLSQEGYKTYIVMPSHGRSLGEKPRAKISINGVEYRVYVLRHRRIEYIVVDGGALSDREVYGPRLIDKTVEYARILPLLLEEKTSLGIREPDIIHAHDWHSVLGLLAVKLYYHEKALRKAFFYHIHLVSKQVFSPQTLASANIDLDVEHYVRFNGSPVKITVREALEKAQWHADRLGGIEADRLITVSRAYLREDPKGVLNTLGWDLEAKSRVVYNGTDWRYPKILELVLRQHGHKIREYLGLRGEEKPSRDDLRKYLLLKALGELPSHEPVVPDPRIEEYLFEKTSPPFHEGLKLYPFYEDGVLVLMTGRISRQKGVDMLVEAVSWSIKRLGDLRFLFFLLPVWGSRDLVDMLLDLSHNYPDHVRIVFGKAPSIYGLAHVAGDLFIAPSRWEPFGIMALEAMATGNIVVAARTGGLKETVLDVREHGVKGTGILFEPGDPYELASSIVDMGLIVKASRSRFRSMYLDMIRDEKLRELALRYPKLVERVRGSGIRRVESTFTWKHSARMLLRVYGEIYSITRE